MSFSDRELLARIIKCEAGGEGEGDNGMKAVTVSGDQYHWVGEGDLRKIIYEKCQYDCMRSVLGGVAIPQTI